ncbi:unnamed protein product, partial [Choristocarpus tenellus]
NWVVERYVENPMLIEGFKFDLRLYVAVTSFQPLRVYLHKEGLCRLATEPYSRDPQTFSNRFVHLTNYSINKHNKRLAKSRAGLASEEEHTEKMNESSMSHCECSEAVAVDSSPKDTHSNRGDKEQRFSAMEDSQESCLASSRSSEVKEVEKVVRGGGEDDQRRLVVGPESRSKWSLHTLHQRFVAMGVDTTALWKDIHSVIIKTLISIEAQVSSAVDMLVLQRGTCFEMFGFDVLVDDKQMPHLMEVNFAPSLNIDTNLDFQVKSKVWCTLCTI